MVTHGTELFKLEDFHVFGLFIFSYNCRFKQLHNIHLT